MDRTVTPPPSMGRSPGMNTTMHNIEGHTSYHHNASSSSRVQRDEQLWDSSDDLPEPVLPWMRSDSRQSLGGTTQSSVDATSLHIVKRHVPETLNKKKQRWTLHKWWLLFSNSVVKWGGRRVGRMHRQYGLVVSMIDPSFVSSCFV